MQLSGKNSYELLQIQYGIFCTINSKHSKLLMQIMNHIQECEIFLQISKISKTIYVCFSATLKSTTQRSYFKVKLDIHICFFVDNIIGRLKACIK